jgi:archaellum component FlaC
MKARSEMSIIEVRKLLQEMVVPELHGLRTDIKVLQTRMDSLEREMDARFNAVDSRLSSLERQMDITGELRERLTRLETKIFPN